MSDLSIVFGFSLGLRVLFRVQGVGFTAKVSGLAFPVKGLGAQGVLGFRVLGFSRAV